MHKMVKPGCRRLAAAIAAALLVVGCTTTPATPPPSYPAPPPSMPAPTANQSPAGTGASGAMLNVTPLTTLTDNDRIDTGTGGIFTNAYTRVLIHGSVASELADRAASEISILPYAPRDPVARYLLGKKFDVNLSVKMRVGAFEATAPLVTLSHQSDSNGEQWSRSIAQRLADFPLFLVTPDGGASVPTFAIKLAGNKAYNSNLIAKSLELITSGFKEVSPASGVLTSLTAASAKNRSRALDAAIGQLFSNGIYEEHVLHRDFLSWREAGGVTVALKIPASESGNWEGRLSYVGSWNITFEAPRPSIFSDWKICPEGRQLRCARSREAATAELLKTLSARQVLNYSLLAENSELATIENLVTRNPWYANAIGAYSGNAVADAAVADRVCTEVQAIVVKLGLNDLDADIVTWALLRGTPAPPRMHKEALRTSRPDGRINNCARALGVVDVALR